MKQLFFIILTLVTFGLTAQEAYVTLETSHEEVELGEPLTLTIKTNTSGQLELNFPDEFIQGGASHSGMSSSVTYQSGQGVVEEYRFQKFNGVFVQEGEFTIGPIKLHTEDKVVSSNTLKIRVQKAVNMISEDPAANMDKAVFGIIQQSKKEVYEGEPLLLEAKVYAQVNVYQVDHYEPFRFEGPASVERLENASQVNQKREVVSNRQVITFQLGKSVVFPELAGQYEISPFEMVLFYEGGRSLFPERVRIRSNESYVKVLPLPKGAPDSFSGAVGKYAITADVKSQQIEQGKVFPLEFTVKGQGNLHLIEAPSLFLPDGVVLYGDPEVNDSIKYSSLGVEGVKKYTYFLMSNNAGKITIPSIKFSYFNPKNKSYEELRTKEIRLNVNRNDQMVSLQPSLQSEEETQTVIAEKTFFYTNSVTSKPNNNWFTPWHKGALGFPVILGLFIGGWKRMKQYKEDKKIIDSENSNDLDFYINSLIKLKNDKSTASNELIEKCSNYFQESFCLIFSIERSEFSISKLELLERNEKISGSQRDKINAIIEYQNQARYSGDVGRDEYIKITHIDEIIDLLNELYEA